MMNKIVFLFACILIFSAPLSVVVAQTETEAPAEGATPTDPSKFIQPKSRLRVKGTTPPSDSSSFIGDPDNLDPLPANRDNIKDDSEPVLDDIRDVLNSQAPASGSPTGSPADANGSANGTAVNGAVGVDNSAGNAGANGGTAPAPEQIQPGSGLVSDDPDMDLEKKFHNVYQRYNKNPTPEEAWSMANSKQTSREYIVQKGDTLWSISQVLFGDPNFWPKLWSVNKQGILNPHFINPGMKINFYEGDENFSPTLSLGDRIGDAGADVPAGASADSVQPSDDFGPENSSASAANGNPRASSASAVRPSSRAERKKVAPFLKIPKSLPEGRNNRYDAASKPVEVRLDFPSQSNSEISFNSEIVISDEQIKGDIEVSADMDNKNCRSSRVLKNVRINEKADAYDIYERIDGFKSSTGFKYAYRLIGDGEILRDKLFKILNCNGFLHNPPVIIGKGKMRDLATTKVSELPEGKIVGGPDFGDQKYYTLLQQVFVDFGTQSFEIGQSFQTVSGETEEMNSQFTVLDKFGSYAVAIITSISDVIEVGDRVSVSGQAAEPQSNTESEMSIDEL